MVELGLIACVICRYAKRNAGVYITVGFLAVSNLSVTNLHTDVLDEVDKPSEEASYLFIHRTAIATFLHHTFVLSGIVILARTHPTYFNGDEFKLMVFKPNEGNDFYYIFGITILLGFYSMVLSLHLAKKVVSVEIGKINL